MTVCATFNVLDLLLLNLADNEKEKFLILFTFISFVKNEMIWTRLIWEGNAG